MNTTSALSLAYVVPFAVFMLTFAVAFVAARILAAGASAKTSTDDRD